MYQILSRLRPDKVTLASWQSKIRHLVQANSRFRYVTRWEQPETADIMYTGQPSELIHWLNTLGDISAEQLPEWLKDPALINHVSHVRWKVRDVSPLTAAAFRVVVRNQDDSGTVRNRFLHEY